MAPALPSWTWPIWAWWDRMTWPVLVAVCLPPLILLNTRPLPSREKIIQPSDERVVLLGASSGVGRDLAHAYAKRGARICIVARRKDALDKVKDECVALGLPTDRVLCLAGDLTNTDHLISIREIIVEAWGGIDTLHILAGVPSTSTLMDIAGVSLKPVTGSPGGPSRSFEGRGPSKQGLDRVAADARASTEINFIATTLSLAAFLPTLASTSRSPAIHHLSSVGAMIPAPRRTIYAATKAAALMAVETCRVECEGCGVRFLSLLPGTIDNDFRKKSALPTEKGNCEVAEGVRHDWEKLLLDPQKVVETILYHLSLNPSPAPLIPIWPLSAISWLKTPPKALVFLPWQYRAAFVFMRDTVLGWLYLEPNARKKYGLPP